MLELIIRAYHQSGDASLGSEALDLLDQLAELGVRLPADVTALD